MSFSMYDYIAPPQWVLRTVENRPNTMIVIGSMGCGKTTWTLSLVARAIERLLELGIDDSEIAVVHSMGTSMSRALEALKSIELPRVRYLYWFNDDAPAARGMHGRRAMSEENVEESRFYVVIRHRLKRMGFQGFMFVVHAAQIYHLIDITFRRMAKIKAFKDYPDEPSDLKIVGPMLGKTYLRKLKEISFKIWSPRDEEELREGLSSAVVKFISRKKVVKVERRDIPKSVTYLKVEDEEDLPQSTVRRAPVSQREFVRLARECGLRNEKKLRTFYKKLFRDILGYAIDERFTEEREPLLEA